MRHGVERGLGQKGSLLPLQRRTAPRDKTWRWHGRRTSSNIQILNETITNLNNQKNSIFIKKFKNFERRYGQTSDAISGGVAGGVPGGVPGSVPTESEIDSGGTSSTDVRDADGDRILEPSVVEITILSDGGETFSYKLTLLELLADITSII